MDTMSNFTCINCQVAFADMNLQRLHYKTDWHRYNLKRKIAEFPPVTSEEFSRRVNLLKEEVEMKNKEKNRTYCRICKKSFRSQVTFDNHLQTKKHVEGSSTKTTDSNTKNVGIPSIKSKATRRRIDLDTVNEFSDIETDSEIEEVDSDEWEAIVSDNNPIINNNCLFCSHHSASLTKNVKHMSVAHSFFIPDVEYLLDLKGLLIYLGEKICQGLMCIWCNDKKSPFVSLEAAQNHMIDKGHTKMLYSGETLLEYSDFYSYGDIGSDDVDAAIELDDHDSLSEGKNMVADDSVDAVLVLPSGATVGHRSLMRYYKQHVSSSRMLTAIANSSNTKLKNVMSFYKALGWKPEERICMNKNVRDLKYMNYVQSKFAMKLSVKNNKFQPHFRQQVNF